jgi:hypothetical protein
MVIRRSRISGSRRSTSAAVTRPASRITVSNWSIAARQAIASLQMPVHPPAQVVVQLAIEIRRHQADEVDAAQIFHRRAAIVGHRCSTLPRSLEAGAHQAASSMEQGLLFVRAKSEGISDIVRRTPLDVAKNNHLANACRQLRDGAADLLQRLGTVETDPHGLPDLRRVQTSGPAIRGRRADGTDRRGTRAPTPVSAWGRKGKCLREAMTTAWIGAKGGARGA